MKTTAADSRLVFDTVSVSIKNKDILHGINGVANSGELLAVMGPTGSGKTTLLNVIAGRIPITRGEVTLNGKPMTKALRRRVAYVLQNDIFLSNLTLYETLYFTAMIRIPDTVAHSEKLARIDEIVDALHIRGCLNTIIGDFMVRGLSGGEKKRANIACELLTDPDIMLIDEPTSGLDSSTAHTLMQQLKGYATTYNKTIIATIHQPSSQIYHMFCKLLLLVNGHTAYFGEADMALTYFDNIGLTCQPNYNPADFLYSSKCILDISTINIKDADREDQRTTRRWPTGFWTQYRMLTWRNYKQSKGRIFERYESAQSLLMAIIGGCMYFQIADTLDTFRDRMGAIFFCVVYWGFNMMLFTISGFPGERVVINKERRAGAYRLSSYYLAKISSELPLLIIMPIIFFSIIYWMSMIGGVSGFFIFIGINLMSCLLIQGLGHIIGALMVNIRHAITVANTIMVGSLVLAGFFNTHFPSWLFWAKYLSLVHYPMSAMVITVLADTDPTPCNQTTAETFEICKTSEFLTGKDILMSVGIDLPIHCYLSTMAILIVLLKIMGYYVLKWKKG
ncbi:hypothetical protein FSP39_001247 [Pinctada imbricata]|uniref:ABC transporter domain-containing protein n=1 Tax=Pinctada imbricata TaxID=66713 RepID=A0AA88XFM9_PINIB|nr:hypothetical protein FSP39_001247 [Pinctada imbricata]